jgi:hypothetical protein
LFSSASTSTIHANIAGVPWEAGDSGAILYIEGAVTNLTIYGNISILSDSNNGYAVVDDGRAVNTTVTVNGNITGGNCSNCYGYNDNSSVGVGSTTYLVVNGDVSGGTGYLADGLYANGTGYLTMTINGNAWGGGTGTDASYGIFNSQSSNVIINGYCIGSNTIQGSNGCYFGSGGIAGDVITGGIINGIYGLGVFLGNAYLYVRPGAGAAYNPSGAGTSYELWPADSSYTLGVVNSHATEFPEDPGTTNVRSGVAYGTFVGTYGGPTCSATPYSF